MFSRRSFTVEKKLEILRWHEHHGLSLRKTASEFGIDCKCLRDWIKKKDVFQMNDFGKQKKKRKIGCGRKPLSEEIDEELFEYFEKEREAGQAVSNKLLGEEARKIGIKHQLTDFKGTAQYIANFKKRMNISMRMGTTDCQKTPEELRDEAEESNLDNPSNPLHDEPVGEYVLPTVPKDVQAATPTKNEGRLDSPSTSSTSFDQIMPMKNSYFLPTTTIIHSNALVPTTTAHVSLLKRKRTIQTPKSSNTETVPSDESTKKLKDFNDEFSHFGNNVASQLRNMALEKALLCQNEIMMVLMKYRVESAQSTTSSSSSLSPTLPQSHPIPISNIKVEVTDS